MTFIGRVDSGPSQPWVTQRRRPGIWGWISLGLLLTGALLAFVWWLIGGLPFGDHDRYAAIPVPGSDTVELPEGDVRLHYQESGIPTEESAETPEGLEVRVTSRDGRPVRVERISENLFSVTVEDTGHVPYGRLDVPRAGTYTFNVELPRGSVTRADPLIAVGEPPINPFGAPIVGAIVIFVPFAAVSLLLFARGMR